MTQKYFLFPLMIVTSAVAQKPIQLKLYQNTDFFTVGYSNSQETVRHENHLNFNRVTLAINWSGKKNFSHEVEIFVPEISKSIYNLKFPLDFEFRENNGVNKLVSTYSFRYELSKAFNPTNKIFFSAGIGANPYFIKTEYEPTVPNIFSSSSSTFGLSFNLIPRINFKVTERVRLDLNIPLKIYDFRFEELNTRNPATPARQQNVTNLSHVLFASSLSMRFGVAFLI